MPIDDIKLQQDVNRGLRAKALLENELLIESFETLEQTYIKVWRASHVGDEQGREKLFLAVNIIAKVRDHLASIVNDGTLAERQLKELADEVARTAERKKRFGAY